MKGIYILTCRPTGKSYVGQSINIKKRIHHHLTVKSQQPISKAIQKYGQDAFDVEIIKYPHISKQLLDIFEQSHIAELDSHQNGYNATRGGDMNPMDDPKVRAHQKKVSSAKTAEMNKQDENKKRMTERNNKNWKDPKYRAKMSKATSEYNKKRWQNPEYRKRMSERIKGDNNPSKKKQNPNQLTLFD